MSVTDYKRYIKADSNSDHILTRIADKTKKIKEKTLNRPPP